MLRIKPTNFHELQRSVKVLNRQNNISCIRTVNIYSLFIEVTRLKFVSKNRNKHSLTKLTLDFEHIIDESISIKDILVACFMPIIKGKCIPYYLYIIT